MIKVPKYYFNTANNGLVNKNVLAFAHQLDEQFLENPIDFKNSFWQNNYLKIKDFIAKITTVNKNQIALVPNFSWVYNYIIHALTN
jgi:hypothetical protein